MPSFTRHSYTKNAILSIKIINIDGSKIKVSVVIKLS